MKTLKIELTNEKAGRPTGNPITLRCVEIPHSYSNPYFTVVKTGVKLDLPDDLTLRIVPIQPDLFVVGWAMAENGLEVIIMWYGVPNFNEPFAQAYIVEQKIAPVRFVEFAKEGGRIVTGEPKEVKDG
jgi:hypothetical protein